MTGFPQIIKAEEYVINHHLGDVISQSFSATSRTSAPRPRRRAAHRCRDTLRHRIPVLAASGDNGAADVGLDRSTLLLFRSWPASDPLVNGVGGTQLHLDANGNRTSPDTAWNDTFSVADPAVHLRR